MSTYLCKAKHFMLILHRCRNCSSLSAILSILFLKHKNIEERLDGQSAYVIYGEFILIEA